MTILESLISLNTFPIPQLVIEKICIDRGLEPLGTYLIGVGSSQGYQLAKADTWEWLAITPDLTEQEIGLKISDEVKKGLKAQADTIYGTYGDSKFSGLRFGFVGEFYND